MTAPARQPPPAIYCVVGKARNDVLTFKTTHRAAKATMEYTIFEARIVKYIPAPRRGKGAARGK